MSNKKLWLRSRKYSFHITFLHEILYNLDFIYCFNFNIVNGDGKNYYILIKLFASIYSIYYDSYYFNYFVKMYLHSVLYFNTL